VDFDPAVDVLVVEAQGRIVGLAWVRRRERQDGTLGYQHSADLIPKWRREGFRQALFEHNERHAP
jgi:GNAT superfamily N-acetyltransferase